MPIDLVLVRHGESEGNLANRLSRRGDHSAFTKEFKERHSSQWRLTDRGIWQAEKAGEWIKENISEVFDRYYSSEYVRALETSARLNLEGAHWGREFYLRERDWGQLDVMSHEERLERYADELKRRERDGFYWAAAGGESMANSCLRTDRICDTLHRECEPMKVVMVCHGGTMVAFMVRLERMTQARFLNIEQPCHPHDMIHNCQVLHYTRRNPENGETDEYLNWVRSVCPWDTSLSKNGWRFIKRKKYTNEELLDEVEKVPRIVNNSADS